MIVSEVSLLRFRAIAVFSLITIAVLGYLVIDNTILRSHHTVSQDGAFRASYNRLTSIIRVEEIGRNRWWNIGECTDPLLLWSSDGRHLAISATGLDSDSSFRMANVMKLEHGSFITVPSMLAVGQQQERRAHTEVVRWLDNERVVVEFIIPAEAGLGAQSGWYVFEFQTRTILEMNTETPSSTARVSAPDSAPPLVATLPEAIYSSLALTGSVVISFDYERIPGSASNQIAVWVEDESGNLVRSLHASRWTASGGYAMRPDSLAVWVARADRANMSQREIDAVSSATPTTGSHAIIWDLKSDTGELVAPGEYTIWLEGTLRWANHVIYAGTVILGAGANEVTLTADFVYAATDRQPALNETSPENSMVTNVRAVFSPD